MLYLKKYFTEGLIQMAILLSLCGVRVDVGLDSYLSPSWQEMILGPTSALTQTQFHNLRNRLDSQSSHPKNLDLDGFFTTRRLLGWLHSPDRMQVRRGASVGLDLFSRRVENVFELFCAGSSGRAGDVAGSKGARSTPRRVSRTDEGYCRGWSRPSCPQW